MHKHLGKCLLVATFKSFKVKSGLRFALGPLVSPERFGSVFLDPTHSIAEQAVQSCRDFSTQFCKKVYYLKKEYHINLKQRFDIDNFSHSQRTSFIIIDKSFIFKFYVFFYKSTKLCGGCEKSFGVRKMELLILHFVLIG